MYKLSFFGGIANERRKFVAATAYQPPPLSPNLQAAIAALGAPDTYGKASLLAKHFWKTCFEAGSGIFLKLIALTVASSIFLSCSVIAGRYILDASGNLAVALLLTVLFFSCEVASHYSQFRAGVTRNEAVCVARAFLTAQINAKLLRVDREYVGDFTKGNLKTLVSSDVESITDFILSVFWIWVPASVSLLVLGPLVIVMGGTLGLVGVLLTLSQIPIAILFGRVIERARMRTQKGQDSLTTLVGEWLKNIRLVRYLGWQPRVSQEIGERFRSYSFEYAKSHITLLPSLRVIAWVVDGSYFGNVNSHSYYG